MIWRCQECGQKVSRHDEPSQGMRVLFCACCRGQTMFRADPEPVKLVRRPVRRRDPAQRWEGRDW